MRKIVLGGILLLCCFALRAQNNPNSSWIKENYQKKEVFITMRDGVKLFTAIYTPAAAANYPILLQRTPYSCSPYGEDKFRSSLGPNQDLAQEKYIFVYQDVRGRYKSEGQFEEVTPAIATKKNTQQVDESSDTYDTIDWLLKHTSNNGRVGLWGISYPGFFATASLPDAHPALKAVSPQAPVSDEFIGDDCNHNGAFFLMDNFGFYNFFEGTRKENGEGYTRIFNASYTDAYDFFLKMGALRHSNGPAYYNGRGKIYSEVLEHDRYDHYWQSRNIRSHLKNIKPAVLVVGGWFDAEDLFGALNTYASIERQSPGNKNFLVMGPWTHGGWAGKSWTSYASHDFGTNLNDYYHNELETPFFNFYLKDKGSFSAAEATVFETGKNLWRQFDQWPPAASQERAYYFTGGSGLSTTAPTQLQSFSEYLSDPAKPVPYTGKSSGRRNNEYMAEDQRFAANRPDVLIFETAPLKEDLSIMGKVGSSLFVSLTGTDADFIVKLIDVLPDTVNNPVPNPKNLQLAGMQRLVRAEVFRGKFRKSFEHPEPFVPGKVEQVNFSLNDVAHTFLKGHRIMVQVQSSWFPLVDRNPQQFISIPKANDTDYREIRVQIHHSKRYPSKILLPVLP